MSKGKILIIEDEATIAIDIMLNLEALGYEVVNTLHRAEDAIAVLDRDPVDLVMLDINLEGEMKGIDLAQIIDHNYNLPFIFLSSYSDEDTLSKAAKTYPATYLVKPFKESDLGPAVKMALIKSQSDKDLRIPTIEKINRNLLSPLTTTEYEIVIDLWNGKLNKIIASERFISMNTVKTHIRSVYSKMEVHSKPDLIQKLRRVKLSK